MKRSFYGLAAAVIAESLWGGLAGAATITVNSGSLISGTADAGSTLLAKATLTQAAPGGSVSITLTNLTTAVDTRSAKELLVGLAFSPAAGFPTGYSISAQTYDLSLSLPDKVGTIGAGGTSHWGLGTSPDGLYWSGHSSGPAIIGGTSDTTIGHTVAYTNDNSSVNNESPAIYETLKLTMTVPTGFDITTLTTFKFLFNTDGTTVVGGTPQLSSTVPLPAAVWSGMGMMAAMGAFATLRKRSRVS